MNCSNKFLIQACGLSPGLFYYEKEGETSPAMAFNNLHATIQANYSICHVAASGACIEARAKFVNDASITASVSSGIIGRINKEQGDPTLIPGKARGYRLLISN